MLSSSRLDRRLVVLIVVLVVTDVLTGYQSVIKAVYPAWVAVFGGMMSTSIRLLFPIVIALLAGTRIADDLAHHHLAATRTRTDIRRLLAARMLQAAVVTFLTFAGITALNGVLAFAVYPAVAPQLTDPALVQMTPAQIAIAIAAPLTPLLQIGTPVFVAGAAMWAGGNAALFGVLTVLAVVLIKRRVLALLVPLGVYLLQSIVLQVQGLPGASFLISALYPVGLSGYALPVALAPSVALGVLVLVGAVVVTLTARTNHRFS